MILPVANSGLVHQDTKHHLKPCHQIHQILTTVDCCCYHQTNSSMMNSWRWLWCSMHKFSKTLFIRQYNVQSNKYFTIYIIRRTETLLHALKYNNNIQKYQLHFKSLSIMLVTCTVFCCHLSKSNHSIYSA